MCTSVCVDGQWRDTIGDLREELNLTREEMPLDQAYGSLGADHLCLCGVDIAEVAKTAGMKCHHDKSKDEWHLYK